MSKEKLSEQLLKRIDELEITVSEIFAELATQKKPLNGKNGRDGESIKVAKGRGAPKDTLDAHIYIDEAEGVLWLNI